MEAFTIFDPTKHADLIPAKIRKLENSNVFIAAFLVTAACIAGYYMYQYYQLNNAFQSDKGKSDI